jgi:hypothetical protein
VYLARVSFYSSFGCFCSQWRTSRDGCSSISPPSGSRASSPFSPSPRAMSDTSAGMSQTYAACIYILSLYRDSRRSYPHTPCHVLLSPLSNSPSAFLFYPSIPSNRFRRFFFLGASASTRDAPLDTSTPYDLASSATRPSGNSRRS